MKEIQLPITNSKGKEATNLQEVLQLFQKYKIFKTFMAPVKPTVEEFARPVEKAEVLNFSNRLWYSINQTGVHFSGTATIALINCKII